MRSILTRFFTAAALGTALSLLAASCHAPAPLSPMDVERCNYCMGKHCAAEGIAANADPARALHQDQSRFVCQLACRFDHRERAWCDDYCGPAPLFNALASCLDASCTKLCPPKEQ